MTSTNSKFKQGRYGKKEDSFLRESIDALTWREMSEVLNRNEDSIRARCRELGLFKRNDGNSIRDAQFNLKERPYFKELESQFTQGELVLFEYHWNRIISQFSGDVLPTEETQIIDTIKLEVMMNRNATQQKMMLESIQRLDAEIKEARDNNEPAETVLMFETQYASLSSGHGALIKEYRELQEKKDKMLKSIRGDRAERVSASTGRMNFITLMQELIANPEMRRQIGIEIEKRRLAMEEAKKKLTEYHKYVDGQVDQPLLTSETVKADNDSLFLLGENQ